MIETFSPTYGPYLTNGYVHQDDGGRDGPIYTWVSDPQLYESSIVIVGSSFIESVNTNIIYRALFEYAPTLNFFPQRLFLYLYIDLVQGSQTFYIRGLDEIQSGKTAAEIYANIPNGTLYGSFTQPSVAGFYRYELPPQAVRDLLSHPTFFVLGIHGATTGENNGLRAINYNQSLEILGGNKPTQ